MIHLSPPKAEIGAAENFYFFERELAWRRSFAYPFWSDLRVRVDG